MDKSHSFENTRKLADEISSLGWVSEVHSDSNSSSERDTRDARRFIRSTKTQIDSSVRFRSSDFGSVITETQTRSSTSRCQADTLV